MRRKLLKRKKGFSLLEVLIALFVMVLGMLGVLMMITNSLKNSQSSRDVITASQLAQEGIEMVRWIRDNNIEADLDPFYNMESNNEYCRADYEIAKNTPPKLECSATFEADNHALYFSSEGADNFLSYNYTAPLGGKPSKFKRIIRVGAGSSEEKKVTSFVFWGSDWESAPDSSTCYSEKKCVYVQGVITDHSKD